MKFELTETEKSQVREWINAWIFREKARAVFYNENRDLELNSDGRHEILTVLTDYNFYPSLFVDDCAFSAILQSFDNLTITKTPRDEGPDIAGLPNYPWEYSVTIGGIKIYSISAKEQ